MNRGLQCLLAALAVVAGLAPAALAADAGAVVVYPGAAVPGAKAHFGAQQPPCVLVIGTRVRIPVELPAGPVRLRAYLRSNTQGGVFDAIGCRLSTEMMSVGAPVSALANGTPLVLDFVPRQGGKAFVYVAAMAMSQPVLKEYAKLDSRGAAFDQRGITGFDPEPDPDDLVEELGGETHAAQVLDATASDRPVIALERLEVEPLPRPTLLPEVAQLCPFVRTPAPSIMTGENFDLGPVEVWAWQPPAGEADIEAGVATLGAALPAEPPAAALRAEILDIDQQVLTVYLPGDVVWVKNRHGWSRPVLAHAARPHWLSAERATPGAELFLYGYALREPGRACRLALQGPSGTVRPVMTRGPTQPQMEDDPYQVYFRVPETTPVGTYTLWASNGAAGRYGWVAAGRLDVVAPAAHEARVIDATKHGADGGDAQCDRAAILAALRAAADAGGGVVYLPPGRYCVEETLPLAAGVTLRGAGREVTVLEGVGYDPSRARWEKEYAGRNLARAPALLSFADASGLEDLTVRGAPARGESRFPHYAMLLGHGRRDVRMERCRVLGWSEVPRDDSHIYSVATDFSRCERLRLIGNDVVGQLIVRWSRRVDIVGNRLWEAPAENIGLADCGNRQAWLDSNVLLEGAGRFLVMFGASQQLIRRNEVHNKFRNDTGSGEGFLVHGGVPAGMMPDMPPHVYGTPVAAGPDTLTVGAKLVPHRQAGTTVMIIRGRGFGQYAIVRDNDETTLTLDRPWRVRPDSTSRFTSRMLFTETTLHANTVVGHNPLVLYYDMIGCIVDGHRQAFANLSHTGSVAGYINEVGDAWSDGMPGAMWFNLMRRCSFAGGALVFNSEDYPQGMPVHLHGADFANFYVENTVTRPELVRRAYAIGGQIAAGLAPAVSLWNDQRGMLRADAPKISGGPETLHWGWPRASHLVFAGNTLGEARQGFAIGPLLRKTFLLGNTLVGIAQPWEDQGWLTYARGNRLVERDAQGREVAQVLPETRSTFARRVFTVDDYWSLVGQPGEEKP